MRRILFIITLLSALSPLAGCTDRRKGVDEIELALDRQTFAVQPWKSDNSHIAVVHGKVTADGKPVQGALVQFGEKRTIESDDAGEFELQVDQSAVARMPVRIRSLAQATAGGSMIGVSERQPPTSASRDIVVQYPIEISAVSPSAKNAAEVEIHGRAVVPDGGAFPVVRIDKYAIYGTVKAEDGGPVKDATVSIRRDGVEGFAKSEPSNDKGEYALYYIPEDDEELQLHVHTGGRHYGLPDRKVYLFPKGTSVRTDITLPKEGTVIQDAPPYLVSRTAPGALYTGLLIGLAGEVDYTATVPKEDGSFVITLPLKVWKTSPAFYETTMSQFLTQPLRPGDTVPSSFMPKPKPDEPYRIAAKMTPGQ